MILPNFVIEHQYQLGEILVVFFPLLESTVECVLNGRKTNRSAIEKSFQKVVCNSYPFSCINSLNVISFQFLRLIFLFSLRYISVPKADYFSARRIGGRPRQGGHGKYAPDMSGRKIFRRQAQAVLDRADSRQSNFAEKITGLPEWNMGGTSAGRIKQRDSEEYKNGPPLRRAGCTQGHPAGHPGTRHD